MSTASGDRRAGNGAIWIIVGILAVLFILAYWGSSWFKRCIDSGFSQCLTTPVESDLEKLANMANQPVKPAPPQATATASASSAAGGTDSPAKSPAPALANPPAPVAACTPTPVMCCPAACPEPAKKKADRPKPAAKATAKPKPPAPVAAVPAPQSVVVTVPAPPVTVTVAPPAPVAVTSVPAATAPAKLFTTEECPNGYTDIVNVWSLTWLEQNRPDLYKEAMELIDAADERRSEQAMNMSAFRTPSFSRVMVPKLLKEPKALTKETMDVQVYSVDPQTKKRIQTLGVVRVVGGVGHIKFETDPRGMVVDYVFLPHVRSPANSAGDRRIRAFGDERKNCISHLGAAVL